MAVTSKLQNVFFKILFLTGVNQRKETQNLPIIKQSSILDAQYTCKATKLRTK